MNIQRKLSIGVTSKSFSQNKDLVSELKNNFSDVKLHSKFGFESKKKFTNFLNDCDAAIVGLDQIDKDILNSCPRLKYISKYGVGLDNIDLKACNDLGVQVAWSEGVNKLSVAEMTLGFMLALARNLFFSSYKLKNGEWDKQGGFQLSGKTIGIIGCGHVGKEVIRLLSPFNCNILVNDIIDQSEYYRSANVKAASKDEIYQSSDLITIHTPYHETTKDLLDFKTFEMCEKSPFIINTARGGIVNESDLIKALDNGLISGAAIDSFVNEPLVEKDIYLHPKIITTPHIGGNSQEAILAMGEAAIENLIKMIDK